MALWLLLTQYCSWHYCVALRRVLHVWLDFTWYVAHLFSLGILTRTLLAPWKRMNDYYAGGGIEVWAEVKILNFFARLVGFVIRLPILLLGCICVSSMFIVLPFLLLLWLMAPVLIIGLLGVGIYFFTYA